MASLRSTKTFALTLLVLWGFIPVVFSQPVDANYNNYIQPQPSPAGIQLGAATTEICNNRIDDDNNGLTDAKDFACYLNSSNPTPCTPSSVIWACEAYGSLFWADIQTGEQKYVGRMSVNLVDISWASNGKLYGCGGYPNGIYEINPYTAATQFFRGLDNYIVSNSMSADGAGNLYVAAFNNTGMNIVKVNLVTWEICFIANLSQAGLAPAGDLTFFNDMLYLACGNSTIAKIDVRTGAITTQTFINASTPGYFGIINLGDDYLYVCDKGNIYRVDPATMTVSSTPTITIGSPNIFIFGLAGYTELCKAPACTAKTRILSSDNPPYCANIGIQLKAALTTCNNTITSVWWTTPAGNTVDGDQVKAMQAGKYYLHYQTTTGTCNFMDSFNLQYAVNASLKVDTSYRSPVGCLCSGTMTVIPGCGSGNFKYVWSNGATTPTVSNVCAGTYSVKVIDLDWNKDTTIYFNIPPSGNTMQNAVVITEGDHCTQHDGSIKITQVQGGIPPYQYALNNQPMSRIATFTNLSTGSYTITIYDDAGCSLQKQVAIQSVPGPEKLSYTKKDAYCGLPGGALTIDSVRNGSPPYFFSINNSPFSSQTTFANIPAGQNTIVIKDNYGCLLNETLSIKQSSALRVAISPKDTTLCATQKVTFKATLLSNHSGVQYIWDNQQPTTTNTFNTTLNADKEMIVKAVDRNGCTAVDTAFVSAVYCDTLFAKCVLFPSAFSPNNDGLNDTFGAHIGHCEIKKYRMIIYNRWGQLIFQSTNIFQRWKGETNGHMQPAGAYAFSCVWEDATGSAHQVKGTVALIK